MDDLIDAARALEPHDVYLLFSHDAHFLNPLVPDEWRRLRNSTIPQDPGILEVANGLLPSRLPGLPKGIYFPAPIARALAPPAGGGETSSAGALGEDLAGDGLVAILDRFHYEMIQVDEDQEWSWRGRPVAERTRRFFLEHLGWQPAIGRYFFEFKIHDRWWDKSYLDAVITPLLGVQLREVEPSPGESEEGALEITTQCGHRDLLDLDGFRLDRRERLFCACQRLGEVLFSDTLRFRLLSGASEDLRSIAVAGRACPLRWPEQPGATDRGAS